MSAFDKIIGYDDIKKELIRFCDVLKNSEKYSKLGVTLPRGILLYGDPGMGKTMMAKAFIDEVGCKTYLIRKDKPDGDFTNKIRETFEEARKNDLSIVFLDDLDKFANEDDIHKDAEEYITVQACIDDSRDSNLFVIATANRMISLPDSLIRVGRFDKQIAITFPRMKDAEKIIKHFLNGKSVSEEVDSYEIARIMDRNSCACLETVINDAGINAGFAGRVTIEKEDIIEACMRFLYGAPPCSEERDEKDKRLVAVHETGHALVGEILDPGSTTMVSIERYSGDIGGITLFHKGESFYLSKETMEHGVIRTLAGKAATEIIYGVSDTGCHRDLDNAFGTISEFIDNLCTMGFEAHRNGDDPSAFLLEKRDRLVASEMERYYQQAKKIIVENRRFFDKFVEELLIHKTLTYKEIQELRGTYA